MKKFTLNKFNLLLICVILISSKTFAQFYDGFNYTVGDNIGGNCTTTSGCNNNGWSTHSNTSGIAGTDNILSGSLNYPGLATSTGNRVNTPGNATTPRDVNAAITIAGNVAYYSALINVTDVTPVSSSSFDYFMHFWS